MNGKAIFQTTELKAYDRVTIGKTELLFMPLCEKCLDGKSRKTIDLGIEKMYQVEISPKSGLAVGKVHGVGDRENQQDAFGISNTAECAVEEKGFAFVLQMAWVDCVMEKRQKYGSMASCLNYFEQYDIQEEVRKNCLRCFIRANHQIRAELGANAGAGGSTVIAVSGTGCKLGVGR